MGRVRAAATVAARLVACPAVAARRPQAKAGRTVRTVYLGGQVADGRVALVDDEDYELVSPYRWYASQLSRGGVVIEGPYAKANVTRDGRRALIYMHKLITGYTMTDHIDHDGLNNQRSNLRPATTTQNNRNKRPSLGRSSSYKGVGWNRGVRKWKAGITVGRRPVHLGYFTLEEDAARAYDAAALECFGEFAYLNFPAALVVA